MLERRTLRIFAALVGVFVLLGLPAYVGPELLASFSGMVVIVPVMSVYLFHALGMPGLLQHQGYCGWGLCNPTPFGVGFTVAVWLLVFWLAAWGLAYLTGRR